MDESQARYYKIMRNLVKNPVHPMLRPIDFSEDMVTCAGVGTLILGFTGQQHAGILTASHLFSIGKNRPQLFYRVCQSTEFYPINKVVQPVKEDVALCLPGPITPILGFSKHTGGFWDGSKQGTPCKAEYADCIQITTGKKIPVVGHVIDSDGECYYVLKYQCCAGESGSGFLRDENELYVLRGSIQLDDGLKKLWDMPQLFNSATLAAGVRFN